MCVNVGISSIQDLVLPATTSDLSQSALSTPIHLLSLPLYSPESLPACFPPLFLCFCRSYVKIQVVRNAIFTHENTVMGSMLCFQTQRDLDGDQRKGLLWHRQSKAPMTGELGQSFSIHDFHCLTFMINHGQRQAEFPFSSLFLPPSILPPLFLQTRKDQKHLHLCHQISRITGCGLSRLDCFGSRNQKDLQLANGSAKAQRTKKTQLEKLTFQSENMSGQEVVLSLHMNKRKKNNLSELGISEQAQGGRGRKYTAKSTVAQTSYFCRTGEEY